MRLRDIYAYIQYQVDAQERAGVDEWHDGDGGVSYG